MTIEWYQYFQLFSLLCALICYRGLKGYSLGIMIPILVLDNATEFLLNSYEFFHWHTNYAIGNLYLLLSTPLFLYLFFVMLKPNKRQKRYYIIAAALLEAAILLNSVFIQGITEFDTFSSLLIESAYIILSCLTLARLTIGKDDESIILQDPRFCLTAMLLLFSLVSLLVLGLVKFSRDYHINIQNKVLYSAIMPIANAVLYTGYSYAFLLCRLQISK